MCSLVSEVNRSLNLTAHDQVNGTDLSKRQEGVFSFLACAGDLKKYENSMEKPVVVR